MAKDGNDEDAKWFRGLGRRRAEPNRKIAEICGAAGIISPWTGRFSCIDRCYRGIDRLQFVAGRDVVPLQLALDLICDGHKFVLRLFGPGSNARQRQRKAALPNASTCRPSRRRTIQNNSTVSKVSESEVAAAAPWPPKRGTSRTQSTTFITNASA
jgi:hypothetical protein